MLASRPSLLAALDSPFRCGSCHGCRVMPHLRRQAAIDVIPDLDDDD
jgi:hypothetical protein